VCSGCGLVKKTVNFDDPGTYHLYYGDEQGQPGTILTFFPWEHAAAGHLGVGETQETALRIPASAVGYWTHRLLKNGVTHGAPEKRFGETVLPFTDAMGCVLRSSVCRRGKRKRLERGRRSGRARGPRLSWRDPAGQRSRADRRDPHRCARLPRGRGRARSRAIAATRCSARMSICARPVIFPRGRMGRGSVHHIAFRAPDDAAKAAMAERLVADHRMQPTGQKDRNYFRSIYFREPNGICSRSRPISLVSPSTSPASELGRALKLPRFLEPRRAELEAKLPPLHETV
jgi:glyoxalase family protein